MVALFLVTPNEVEAQRKKTPTPANPYVLNESLAKALVGAYVRTNWSTSVVARTPDFSKQLNEETLLDYRTVDSITNNKNPADGTAWTEGNWFMVKLIDAALLDTNTRLAPITNITGEYELQNNTGKCSPMRLKLSHKSSTSPDIVGTATWVTSLYRDCDYPQRDSVSGVVDESGSILLRLPNLLASDYYWFVLVNGILEPRGGKGWLENKSFRRLTDEMPQIKITKYKYSLTKEARAFGLTASGGAVKIGEMTFNGVSNLLLQGPTNATGVSRFSYRYNRLRAVLMPNAPDSLARRVSFGQRPDGKWVFTGFQ